MQVKVHQAMRQESDTCHQAGKMNRGGKGAVPWWQAANRLEEQDSQEPGATESPWDSRLRQPFQIIIMRVVYNFAVV